MRILFDSNVWLSAFVASGACEKLLKHCADKHQLVVSSYIIAEIEKKLLTSGIPPEAYLHFIAKNTELIKIKTLHLRLCRDPKDDPILATAQDGNVDCIVTGDKDLLVIEAFGKIPIIRPRDFWKLEKEFTLN